MITLNVNLKKEGRKYKAYFVADENGKELFTDDWGFVTGNKTKMARRMKAFQLDGKTLAVALNVIDPTKDIKDAKVRSPKEPKG